MITHGSKTLDDTPMRPYELARKASANLYNNECDIVMVYGMPEGVGKSAYVNHALADVQGWLKCKEFEKTRWMWKHAGQRPKETPIWDTDYEGCKPLVKYTPEDVINFLMNLLSRGERIPAWEWDDGGTWLNTMEYSDPFVIGFMEFLPLARSVCGLVIISTPVEDWLLKKLRTALGVIHAPVIKTNDANHIWKPRRCKAYMKIRNPVMHKCLIKYQWEDNFSAIMPDDFYGWYKPLRDSYTLQAVAKLALALEKRKAKGTHVEIDEGVLAQIKESVAKGNDKAKDFRELIAQKAVQ